MSHTNSPSSLYYSGLALFLITFALSGSVFMYVLDYSIANVALPYIAGDLAVSVEQGTYVITSFAVGNAIALPMTGWLSRRFGLRQLLVFSILFFTFMSWACGASINFEMLIFSRFIQGIAAGPLIPLAQSAITLVFPPEKRTMALGFFSTVTVIAPVMGPVLGGVICYNYVWPWIFYLNIPFGLACASIIYIYLKRYDTKQEVHPFDIGGLIFMAIGATCLQVFIDKGEQWDWFRSDLVVALSLLSLIAFICLIGWELNTKKPLINFQFLKKQSFATACFLLILTYGTYFGIVVLIPLWLQTYMNYTAYQAGLAVMTIGFVPIVMGLFIGKIVDKLGTINSIYLCLLIFVLSCYMTTFLYVDIDITYIQFTRFILGIGFAFYITPMMALSLEEIEQEEQPHALGFFHFIRSLAGGIGTSLYTTLWNRRTIFHHEALIESITPYNPNYISYNKAIGDLPLASPSKQALLNGVVDQQAATLAMNDAFYLMTLLCIVLIPITFLLTKGRKKGALIKEKRAALLKPAPTE